MDALKRAGIPTEIIRLNNDLDNFDEIRSFQLYGTYPFSFYKVLTSLKESGKRIVYDLDDALEWIDNTNPHLTEVAKSANSQKEILPFVDHVTVSTEVMATYMRERTDKPITVVPNCYMEEEWTFPRPQREGIRIAYSGSSTHVPDLIRIIPTIKKLQEKHNVVFMIQGFGPGDYESFLRDFRFVSKPEGLKAIDELDALLKTIRFEWVPFINYTIYPQVITNMSIDIGLCPLIDTPFNRARSACKALEYNLAGALVLASDLAPYQSEPTSVLVKDNEWDEKLTYYVEHPEERKTTHETHLNWMRENREIKKLIPLLQSIYLP